MGPRGPWRYLPVLGVLFAMPLLWRRARSALAACGERAAAGTARRYSLTAQGLLLTLAVAAPGPAVAWLLARRVAAADQSEFGQAAAAGLATAAATYLPLEILRQSGRPRGLMAAHFRWSARAVPLIRRQLGWFAGAALPFVFVIAAVSSQENQAWQHGLGRLALIALTVAGAVFLARVLHPGRGVFAELLAANRGDWRARLRNVWYVAAVSVPLGPAGVAVAGYMYAAAELAAKALETLWLVTVAVVVYGMVSRWVLVSRRTLAFRQRRERAQAEHDETIEPGPDLGEIDARTRRLIRTLATAAGLGGLWLVWSDVVPALSILEQVVLWPLGAAPGAEGVFTLEHLVLALILGVLTAALARNVPALLEMLLLSLPINPGSRYALTSMSRYVLLFSGALAIFGVMGVTWSSVQWLVAAFGVGLGLRPAGDLRELRLGVAPAGRATGACGRHHHRRGRDGHRDADSHSRDDDSGLGPEGAGGPEQGPRDRPPSQLDAVGRGEPRDGLRRRRLRVRRGTSDTGAARDRRPPPP